jgi:hypothetical protein
MTASFNEGSGLIGKWMTNKNTLESFVFQKSLPPKRPNTPAFLKYRINHSNLFVRFYILVINVCHETFISRYSFSHSTK